SELRTASACSGRRSARELRNCPSLIIKTPSWMAVWRKATSTLINTSMFGWTSSWPFSRARMTRRRSRYITQIVQNNKRETRRKRTACENLLYFGVFLLIQIPFIPFTLAYHVSQQLGRG